MRNARAESHTQNHLSILIIESRGPLTDADIQINDAVDTAQQADW